MEHISKPVFLFNPYVWTVTYLKKKPNYFMYNKSWLP